MRVKLKELEKQSYFLRASSSRLPWPRWSETPDWELSRLYAPSPLLEPRKQIQVAQEMALQEKVEQELAYLLLPTSCCREADNRGINGLKTDWTVVTRQKRMQ